MNPCVYGIDFPDRSKLMAANNSVDEIRKYLNADSLHYLSQDGMVDATGQPKETFCMACYDGNYPVRLRSRCWTSTSSNAAARRRKPLAKPRRRRTSRLNYCRFSRVLRNPRR